MNYTVTEGNYLRFGLQSVKDGVIFTFAGEKEDVCEVILYDMLFPFPIIVRVFF